MDDLNKDIKVEENDESELDKSLEETIASIRAVSPEVPTLPSDSPKEESPTPAPKDVASDSSVVEGLKVPMRLESESEESYHKRLELADLVAERKAAKTSEEKKQIQSEISKTRNELKHIGKSSENINNLNSEEPSHLPEIDEAMKQDKARFKELGGMTKEDIQEVLQQERFASDVKSTLENFVERHPQLKDEDTREVFFDFVDSNYNWANKSGKDLMTVLELARENMFKPSESISDRVLKGANVQDKVNAMQFPGGTIVKPSYTADQRRSIDELTATGMSEAKALELISD